MKYLRMRASRLLALVDGWFSCFTVWKQHRSSGAFDRANGAPLNDPAAVEALRFLELHRREGVVYEELCTVDEAGVVAR
jgi:hypothetical protein